MAWNITEIMQEFAPSIDQAITLSKKADFYERLGVDSKADDEAIKKHYRKLARVLHPDYLERERQDLRGEASREPFQRIGEAFETLSEPSKRKSYDLTRRSPTDQNMPGGHRTKSDSSRTGDSSSKNTGTNFSDAAWEDFARRTREEFREEEPTTSKQSTSKKDEAQKQEDSKVTSAVGNESELHKIFQRRGSPQNRIYAYLEYRSKISNGDKLDRSAQQFIQTELAKHFARESFFAFFQPESLPQKVAEYLPIRERLLKETSLSVYVLEEGLKKSIGLHCVNLIKGEKQFLFFRKQKDLGEQLDQYLEVRKGIAHTQIATHSLDAQVTNIILERSKQLFQDRASIEEQSKKYVMIRGKLSNTTIATYVLDGAIAPLLYQRAKTIFVSGKSPVRIAEMFGELQATMKDTTVAGYRLDTAVKPDAFQVASHIFDQRRSVLEKVNLYVEYERALTKFSFAGYEFDAAIKSKLFDNAAKIFDNGRPFTSQLNEYKQLRQAVAKTGIHDYELRNAVQTSVFNRAKSVVSPNSPDFEEVKRAFCTSTGFAAWEFEQDVKKG